MVALAPLMLGITLLGTSMQEYIPKRTTFCERLQVACTEAVAAELMNVSGL